MNTHNISDDKIKKLVPNSFDKERYVLQYRKLQQYLKLGIKLKRLAEC